MEINSPSTKVTHLNITLGSPSVTGNITLFLSRMQAAVDLMRSRSDVDPDRIALIGYCFGGTGVLNYAIAGKNVSGKRFEKLLNFFHSNVRCC